MLVPKPFQSGLEYLCLLIRLSDLKGRFVEARLGSILREIGLPRGIHPFRRIAYLVKEAI